MSRTRSISVMVLSAIGIVFGTRDRLLSQTNAATHLKNIVLVHGAFVDGSGWEGVYKTLKKSGYTVTVVQNPTVSLEDDVAITRRAIAAQNGPVILVGHSYGGAVITEAGNDPNVAGLRYVDSRRAESKKLRHDKVRQWKSVTLEAWMPARTANRNAETDTL